MRRSVPLGSLLRPSRAVGLAVLIVAGAATGQPAERAIDELQPLVDSHVVEPGDTLWDLSSRVLGDPFLWPRVWSFNPEITNPHWIYPGDIVRFYPNEQTLPSQTELIADRRDLPEIEQDLPEEEEVVATHADGMRPPIEVIDGGAIRRPPAHRTINQFVGLFVTAQELAEAGTLTNAAEDKMLFGPADQVYLSFPKEGAQPKTGDRYMVYRTLGEIRHPVSKKQFGFMTQVTGLASVEMVAEEVTRARLDQTVVEIERGQYVAPIKAELFAAVNPQPAKARIEGVVLAVHYDGGVIAAQHQVVFIDKGSEHGVSRGDILMVVAQGDPVNGRVEKMPVTEIAKLVVVQVNEIAATCMVTASRREIEPGARVLSINH